MISYLDVGPIAGTDNQTAVENELRCWLALARWSWRRQLTFMLLVPDASVPAVEMCSLMSLAGTMISALLTL